MATASDDALDDLTVRRALRGDREALAAVWRAHHPAVVRFLRAIGTPDSDDVAAEVWVEVMRRAPEVGDTDDLLTVLFTIARRRSIDRHRQRVRRPEALGHAIEVPTGAGTEVETRLDAIGLLQRLEPAVAEVVYLRAALALPAAMVGAITGRSEGAVRVMAMRGLRTLRALAADLDERRVTDPDLPAMVQT